MLKQEVKARYGIDNLEQLFKTSVKNTATSLIASPSPEKETAKPLK